MTRYVFEELSQRATKRVKCAGCGKAVTRSKTFRMTLNPYNKNPDGTVRSRRDIGDALSAERQAWRQEPESCTACLREALR